MSANAASGPNTTCDKPGRSRIASMPPVTCRNGGDSRPSDTHLCQERQQEQPLHEQSRGPTNQEVRQASRPELASTGTDARFHRWPHRGCARLRIEAAAWASARTTTVASGPRKRLAAYDGLKSPESWRGNARLALRCETKPKAVSRRSFVRKAKTKTTCLFTIRRTLGTLSTLPCLGINTCNVTRAILRASLQTFCFHHHSDPKPPRAVHMPIVRPICQYSIKSRRVRPDLARF